MVKTINKLSSILFRYESENNPSCPFSTELHINFWDIDQETDKQIMDIGFLFEANANLKKIIISVPGKYQSDDILDLGETLIQEKMIISSIFNETIKSFEDTTNSQNIKNATITLDTYDEKKFTIISIDTTLLNCVYNRQHDYTDIIIPIKNIIYVEKRKIYIRIRIDNIKNSNFINNDSLRDAGILSSTIQQKTIDFRINTRRSLPIHLTNNFIQITKLHCFLIIPHNYNLLSTDKNYVTYRSLFEESNWEKYLEISFEREINIKQCNGYQWTSKIDKNVDQNNTLKDISIIGSFSRATASFLSITTSISFLVTTGVIGGTILDIIYKIRHDSIVNRYILLIGLALIIFLVFLPLIQKSYKSLCIFLKKKIHKLTNR